MITGAASGIGRAIAHRFATEGARVVVTDLDATACARAAQEIRDTGGAALEHPFDVSSEAAWTNLMDRLMAEWGRLDVCVNSAGVALARPIVALEFSDWRRVLAVNLDGTFLGTRQALRVMQSGRGGCILNLASQAGIDPYAGNTAYGTSKAAIRFFTRIAALETAPHRVRIHSLSPGAVATPMWRGTPFWPLDIETAQGTAAALQHLVAVHGFTTPEQVAETALFLASDEAANLNGLDVGSDVAAARRHLLTPADPTVGGAD